MATETLPVTGHSVGQLICDALGIDASKTSRIIIDISQDDIVRVITESWMEDNRFDGFLEVLKKCRPVAVHSARDTTTFANKVARTYMHINGNATNGS